MSEVVSPLPEKEQPAEQELSSEQKRPIGFIGLMRNRNYALLWWGQLVSELGNQLHWVAISLWIFSATHSASAVSLAISSMFVGNLLVSLWAGVLIDWFDRKKILIFADLARALLVALIPSLMKVNLRLVYVDIALISVATAFFRPGMFAIMPTIVGRRDLLPANSFFVTMSTGTEIFGPAIAGIVAFVYGYAPLLYLDSATFAFSALCLLVTRIPSTPQTSRRQVQLSSVTASVSEGLRYIRQDSLQWGLFVLMFPAYLVGSGLNALRTPLAKGVIGITDAQFGTFGSVWGIGFVTASLLLGWFGGSLRKSYLILGGFFLGFASTAAMGLSNSFDSLLAAAFMVGFANTLNFVGLTTVLMEYTPQGVIGRVMSTRQAALGTTRVFSPVIFGAIGDVWGVRPAIASMVLVGAVGTAVVAILVPVLRRFDAPTGQPTGQPRSVVRGVLDSIVGKTNPEYDHAQQVALNSVTTLIIVVAWIGLAYHYWTYASVGLIVVLGLTILGASAKRWLRTGSRERPVYERLFAITPRWFRSRQSGQRRKEIRA